VSETLLSEADQLNIAASVDWCDWASVQSFRFRPGKGATSFLRSFARRCGLAISIQRAGDLIFLTLRIDETETVR